MDAKILQAGAVAFRQGAGRVDFLIVRARRNPENWIFPKGHIEPGESAVDAAVRELREEAGILGEPLGALGAVEFLSWKGELRVQYFLCRFLERLHNGDGRELKWCPAERAFELLSFEEARTLIRTALSRLA